MSTTVISESIRNGLDLLSGRRAEPPVARPADVRLNAPMPPAVAPEVLDLVAKIRGGSILDELRATIREIDASFGAHRSELVRTGDARHYLSVAGDLIERRRIYEHRLAELKRRLGVEEAEDFGPTPDLEAIEGLKIGADVRAGQSVAAAGIRAELARVVSNLEGAVALYESNEHAWRAKGHDAALAHLHGLVTRRDELRVELAALEQDQARAGEAQGALIKAAVESAGGVEAVSRGVDEARALAGSFVEQDPELHTLVAELVAIESTIERLSAVPGGNLAARSRSRRDEIHAAIQATRARIGERRHASSVALIARAYRGDEGARAELERLANDYPGAFPPGFVQAVHDAKYERAQLAALRALVSPQVDNRK